MDCNIQEVDAIIEQWGAKPDSLLQIMLDINHRYHYLPKESVKRVAERLEMPLNQLFSVATFFKVFSLVPRGRTIVHICHGTACHVKGAPKLLDRFEKDLKLRPGETTADLALTLETVNCVGACSAAPVVLVDGVTHTEMSANKISKLAKELKAQEG